MSAAECCPGAGDVLSAVNFLMSLKQAKDLVRSIRGKYAAKRPGNRGYPDYQADVRGAGRAQAQRSARPGEFVITEQPIQGHPDINRRADNQVVDVTGKTRIVVESERRPTGSYHKERVKELQRRGIEVQTRELPRRRN